MEGENLNEQIYRSVVEGYHKDVKLFIFTDNLVFESVFYKGTSKIPFLFEIALRLH